MSAAEVTVYDRIGDHYQRGRREDRRIAAACGQRWATHRLW
jgi:hypothetical protein